jgi:hypothetical protein
MTILRRALLTTRSSAAAIMRAGLAFDRFWNIPALGEIEMSGSRRDGAIHHL